jgi:hypothetical protein
MNISRLFSALLCRLFHASWELVVQPSPHIVYRTLHTKSKFKSCVGLGKKKIKNNKNKTLLQLASALFIPLSHIPFLTSHHSCFLTGQLKIPKFSPVWQDSFKNIIHTPEQ